MKPQVTETLLMCSDNNVFISGKVGCQKSSQSSHIPSQGWTFFKNIKPIPMPVSLNVYNTN